MTHKILVVIGIISITPAFTFAQSVVGNLSCYDALNGKQLQPLKAAKNLTLNTEKISNHAFVIDSKETYLKEFQDYCGYKDKRLSIGLIDHNNEFYPFKISGTPNKQQIDLINPTLVKNNLIRALNGMNSTQHSFNEFLKDYGRGKVVIKLIMNNETLAYDLYNKNKSEVFESTPPVDYQDAVSKLKNFLLDHNMMNDRSAWAMSEFIIRYSYQGGVDGLNLWAQQKQPGIHDYLPEGGDDRLITYSISEAENKNNIYRAYFSVQETTPIKGLRDLSGKGNMQINAIQVADYPLAIDMEDYSVYGSMTVLNNVKSGYNRFDIAIANSDLKEYLAQYISNSLYFNDTTTPKKNNTDKFK